jgi:hypothetical protein
MVITKNKQLHGEGRWVAWSAISLIASLATLVQAYLAIKLAFLGLFLLVIVLRVALGKTTIVVYRPLVWFYLWISLVGAVWSLVGTLHPQNHFQGYLEAFRIYTVWNVGFLVLYTLIRALPSLEIMHKAMVAAGILIPLINFLGLYDQLSGLGLFSDSMREALRMEIGFGNGHVQYGSANIGMLFLIAPYLLSMQFRADAGKSNSILTKIAMVLSLTLVVLSGRRALWLVVAFTPFTILLFSRVGGSFGALKTGGRRFLLIWAVAGVVSLGTLFIVPESSVSGAAFIRIRQAFSSEDERTIQKPYLLDGFMNSPIFGSGFGASASYLRSDERPWMYELTYYQMLFNLGIVGMTTMAMLISIYLVRTVKLFRQFKHGSAVPFALLVACCSLFIGAYSDPYFGGFDALFFVGLLPYLSTFQRGFVGELCAEEVAV